MITPGVYTMMTAADYHADNVDVVPSLSASIAKLLVSRTPFHARFNHPKLNPEYEPEERTVFDLGNAAHSLMLHDPKDFKIIDAPDWRGKKAKKLRDDARVLGKIPLLTEQWERVTAMVAAGRAQLDAHEDASGAFTDGKPESTLVWGEDGVICRGRLDWMPNAGPFYDDYKTSGCADPDVFLRQIINLGHDIQAAFYLRGVRALKLHQRPVFRFIVQEVDPPYPLSVICLAPDFLDLANHKVARAIDIWRTCLQTNRWPGYPTRTCWLESPAWHEAQYTARDARTHEASQADMQRAIAAQAPL